MNTSEIERQVKRINERIADISRTFGTDSYQYQRYEERIQKIFGEKQFFYGSGDRIALSHGKKVTEDKDIEMKLKRLENLSTVGKMKRKARRSLQEEGIKKPSKAEILERAQIQSDFDRFFDEHKEEFYKYTSDRIDSAISTMHQSHKTYDELHEVMKVYNEEIAEGKAELLDLVKGLERK